jgi:hypothetical protein
VRREAEALAKELGADIEELRCARYRVGLSVFIRASFDSWTGALPPIEPLSHDLLKYDLVVIAGPIWAWHAATPLLRLRAHPWRLCGREVSSGTEGYRGTSPGGQPRRKDRDIRSGNVVDALRSFAAHLRTAAA